MILLVVILFVLILVGYSLTSQSDKELIIAGSTTIFPIIEKIADNFDLEGSDKEIFVIGASSEYGLSLLNNGEADIATVSRDLTTYEIEQYCILRYPSLYVTTIARDGVLVVVNPKNTIDNLTSSQIRDIYTGRIRNWKDVGGEDREIVLLGRVSSSGTRQTFESLLNIDKVRDDMVSLSANSSVLLGVSEDENAIGYIGHGYLDSSRVKALSVDDIEGNIENISKGVYPLVRNLNLVTRGAPKGDIKDFIDFMFSKEGKNIIKEEGYIPVPYNEEV
jgi:phosphate transport system substrate-binding protein